MTSDRETDRPKKLEVLIRGDEKLSKALAVCLTQWLAEKGGTTVYRGCGDFRFPVYQLEFLEGVDVLVRTWEVVETPEVALDRVRGALDDLEVVIKGW